MSDNHIRVRWVFEPQFGYGTAMRVIDSDHARFVIGSRFDYGFMSIAAMDGYSVYVEAVSPAVRHAVRQWEMDRERADALLASRSKPEKKEGM